MAGILEWITMRTCLQESNALEYRYITEKDRERMFHENEKELRKR